MITDRSSRLAERLESRSSIHTARKQLPRLVMVLALALSLGAQVFAPTPVDASWTVVLPRAWKVCKFLGTWAGSNLAWEWLTGKNRETAQDFRQELKEAREQLIQEILAKTGPERRELQEGLRIVQHQLKLLERLLADQQSDLDALLRENKELEKRLTALERRLDRIEEGISDLGDRMSRVEGQLQRLEEAQYRSCLDLRLAPLVGDADFRHKPTSATLFETFGGEDAMKFSVRLRLDACTSDLVERGFLVEITSATFGRTEPTVAYLTLTRVGGPDRADDMLNPAAQWETQFDEPDFDLDVQVREIFIPYSEFPDLHGRLAVALTAWQDGGLIYSVPSRPFLCTGGTRTTCRWARN